MNQSFTVPFDEEVLIVTGMTSQEFIDSTRFTVAAKLWMDYIYSDEGQLGFLKGYCHPARFNAMAAAGKIPQDLLDALPPAESYEAAYFPTLEEVDANKAAVTAGWDATVGANVE